MIIGAIINADSGSTPADADVQLKAALEEIGHELVLPEDASGDLAIKVSQLIRRRVDIIIVWGGDGTIGRVLTEMRGHPTPVLVLPGGTMNLLPKQIHKGEMDWRKILSNVLARPREVWLPAGQVGDKRFFVAALFGQLTLLGESRESVRDGELMEAVSAIARGDALDIAAQISLRMIPGPNAAPLQVTAAAIVLDGNDEPGMELAAIAPNNHFDLFAAAMEALMNGWREGADFHAGGLSTIILDHTGDGAISATIDGEPWEAHAPLEVIYLPQAACVLMAGETL